MSTDDEKSEKELENILKDIFQPLDDSNYDVSKVTRKAYWDAVMKKPPSVFEKETLDAILDKFYSQFPEIKKLMDNLDKGKDGST